MLALRVKRGSSEAVARAAVTMCRGSRRTRHARPSEWRNAPDVAAGTHARASRIRLSICCALGLQLNYGLRCERKDQALTRVSEGRAVASSRRNSDECLAGLGVPPPPYLSPNKEYTQVRNNLSTCLRSLLPACPQGSRRAPTCFVRGHR